jgi:hypothetical protein
VALPEREDITRRIVRAAQLETAEQEPRPPRAGLRARYIDTIRGLSSPPMPAVFAEAFADALLAVRDEELDVLSDENDRLAKQVAAAGIEG